MRFYKDLRIGYRLGCAFGALLLALVGSVLLGLHGTNAVRARMHDIVNINNQELMLVTKMSQAVHEAGASVRDLVLVSDEVDMEKISANLKLSRQHYDEAETKLSAIFAEQPGTTAEEMKLFAAIQNAKANSRPALTRVADLGLQNNEAEGTLVFHTQAYPLQTAWLAELNKLAILETTLNDEAIASAEVDYNSSRLRVLAMSLLAVAGGVMAAVTITRSITKPVNYALQVVRTVSDSDLSSYIDTERQDEVGQLMAEIKRMQKSLAKVVRCVNNNAIQLAVTTDEIYQNNNNLSSRTEQQAGSLEETAASIVQLSTTVQHTAQNAHEANNLAQTASTIASKGGEMVRQVVDTMTDIDAASKKIADIIAVIDGIAFQTNILALNAAVEAARAGEQGRGFAVVASEVRNLAGRSAESAKEIKALIHDSETRVNKGSALVHQTGQTMSEMVDAIQRVTTLMSEISHACNEQSQGVHQIEEAVTHIDQVTQQNASLVEEMAASGVNLNNQAKQLVEAVKAFKLPVEAHATAQRQITQENLRLVQFLT